MKGVFMYDPKDLEVQERLNIFPKTFIDGQRYTSLELVPETDEPDLQVLDQSRQHAKVVAIVENVDVSFDATTGEKYISITTGPLAGRITKK